MDAQVTGTTIPTVAPAVALFTPSQLSAIGKLFEGILRSNEAESNAWKEVVKMYWAKVDGVMTADKARKAALAASYKVHYTARIPDANDGTPKMMFSRGTLRAEYALGYKVMPAPTGRGTAAKGKQTAAGSAGAPTTGVDSPASLKAAAIARELADSVAHFQTHEKLTKSATEAIGKIAAKVLELNIELGNSPL